jgi:hypothetical protein
MMTSIGKKNVRVETLFWFLSPEMGQYQTKAVYWKSVRTVWRERGEVERPLLYSTSVQSAIQSIM